MIFLLSGPPGAGKSSVATALMERFPQGVHVPMDELREWVVSGRVGPELWTDETTRQFHLARTVAAYTANLYQDAGFAVAIADVLSPADVEVHFTAADQHQILLLPSLDATLARNAARTNKSFETSSLVPLIERVYDDLLQQDWTGWTILDTTHLTLEETVDAILEKTQ